VQLSNRKAKGKRFGTASPKWWLKHPSPLGRWTAPCKGLWAN